MALAAIGASVRRTPTAAAFHAAAVAAAIGCALLIDDARAAESARDWSRVELAWRDDPRVPADLPATGDGQQRSLSRRAARRAARRGRPLDGGPAVVGRPDVGGPGDGIALPASAAPPIAVDGTLGTTIAAPADGVLVHRDLPVGEAGDRWRRFDLYLPDACATGGLPLVVWIGGSDTWDGTRAACPLRWLVARGYAVACIGYRPQGTAVFPAQLDDCRAALHALCAEATTWGIDPARICLAGRGSGGQLAALVAFTPADQQPIREASTDPLEDGVAAVAIFDAPTHLPSLGVEHDRAGSAESRLVGGPLPEFREAAQKASPLAHVSADAPPTLIVHGSRGDSVALEQGARLDAALRAAGVDSTLVVLDAKAAALAPRQGTASGGALVEFLDRTVGPAAPRIEP